MNSPEMVALFGTIHNELNEKLLLFILADTLYGKALIAHKRNMKEMGKKIRI